MTSTFSPPEVYSFPPFFTLQPEAETRQKQLALWCSYVLAYCRAHGKTVVRVVDDASSTLFSNPAIDRRLSADAIVAVLDEVVRSGHAVWEDVALADVSASSGGAAAAALAAASKLAPVLGKQVCVVSPRPFSEWGTALAAWAKESSGGEGNIYTLYELREGDETRGTIFHGIESIILLEALRALARVGKATLIAGGSLDETGVKFHVD